MQRKSSAQGRTRFAEDDMIYNRDLPQVLEFFGHKYAVADLLKIHKEHLMTIKY